VTEVGAGVTGFAPGEEVYARLDKDRLGGFAEYVAVAAPLIARKPATIDHDRAAAIPLAAQTAWQALTEGTPLGAGATILVHGGAGGVGSFAVQFGRHLGTTVIATASARNAALVTDLGADLVIDYRSESFVHRMRALDHRADLVLDTQGGEVLRRSFEVVRRGGAVITIAGLPTPDAVRGQANALTRTVLAAAHIGNRRRARRAGASFAYLFQRPDGGHLRQFADLVDGGKLRPVIDRVVPFGDAPQALAHVERGGGPGKTVVRMNP
jgi:NADPH:quinone reductase-like Zn-dependent oxidoreductase